MLPECAWRKIAQSLRLSGRESAIARAVFDDRKEAAIAAVLNISPHTVHTHFERLYRKLAVSDRLQLVLRILREFLTLTVAPRTALQPICQIRSAGRCPLQR
ncbi:MAG: helix-turn-helix transcriptional regulator [Planctomycetes bacterium]|nr:helix-turn-helix transcriptional regulator [Planctomycetota bacterium]